MAKQDTVTRKSPGVHPAKQISYKSGSGTVWPVEPRDAAQALDQLGSAPSRQFYNGTFMEKIDALVTSDGADITMSLEQTGGGDLTMNFSDGQTELDCTPALTIGLTAGTQAVPQKNFIYIPQSTKVLTKSVDDWPATEHIRVGFFIVQTAALVQDPGELANQNINDHAMDEVNLGHLAHICARLRASYALYKSGLALTVTDGAALDIAITSGVGFQLHPHTVPAFDTTGGDLVHVVNDSVAAYATTSDPEDLMTDSNGVAMTGRYYNLVIWRTVNKTGEPSPVLINLPAGSYNSLSNAEDDSLGYDNYSMPSSFTVDSSTGLLLYRITLKHAVGGGGTWTHHSTKDLRGSTPVSLTGTGTGTSLVEFADSVFKVFNNADSTKIITLDASGITPGNSRALTMPDQDVDLTPDSGTYPAAAHKDRHDPEDGGDPLDTAAPPELAGVQASGTGSAHTLARSDHAHQIQHSIADNHLLTVDGSPNNDEIGVFTENGMRGRTIAELHAALGLTTHRTLEGLNFNVYDFLLDESAPPRYDLAQHRPVLVFDHALSNIAYTRSRVMPGQYVGGRLKATILYSMVLATTGSVYFDVAVEALTPNTGGNSGDTTDLDTTSSFDTDNTGSDIVPDTTAGKLGAVTMTLTNEDSVAAGDLVRFRLKSNTTDTDDSRVYAMEIWEDLS